MNNLEATEVLREPPGIIPPGETKRRGIQYELIGCGLRGHELVGRDISVVAAEDADLVRDEGGLRWYRCLRCDAWVPMVRTDGSSSETESNPKPIDRSVITVPQRGKLLRDRYVLRLIAIDRASHFIVLGVIAVFIVLFAEHQHQWATRFVKVLNNLQQALGGHSALVNEIEKSFTLKSSTVWIAAGLVAAYALLEGVEAIGLWFAKRWAEYLTFIATTVLLIPEIYEIAQGTSWLKIVTMILNIAVVVYLLVAKRLFGIRGGGAAEAAERRRDIGWSAVDSVLPGPVGAVKVAN
ncbi:MAG: DUF2127 domain-containing protein [Antricoccus sp.]